MQHERLMLTCKKCKKEIESKGDLSVGALHFLIPKPYHKKCFKETVASYPIRRYFWTRVSPSWTEQIIGILIGLVIFIGWVFFMNGRGLIENPLVVAISIFIFLFLVILPVIEKAYSFSKYEKKLG